VLVPFGNKKDVDELPATVKDDVQFVFVKNIGEVFVRAFA
jgi:ATP-dependent Lon protease